jgi:DNA-binding transcriptional LysR family regulator
MHTVPVSHTDLGLLQELRALAVLLEERQVSRAAVRFHLSQSSMSRALQRLRVLFGDELLVRSGSDYELTPRARRIQQELALLLPQIENLLSDDGFDPSTATGTLRVVSTDYATSVLGPSLLPRLSMTAPSLEVRIEPMDQDSYADLERGRTDLLLSAVAPSAPLRWEQLFTDDFVCLVDRAHPARDRFSLRSYLAARHVVVTLMSQEQPLIERQLQGLGHSRTAGLRVAFFSAALIALPGTTLVATVPRRLAETLSTDSPLRLVEAPVEFDAFPYGMLWHARLDNDPTHSWMRGMVRAAARDLAER